jgi:CheY-like chemotaxis protein
MPTPLFILHVEDDLDDAELLQMAFRNNGISCTIQLVKEGNKVVEWLEQAGDLPSVIVLDLNLPKISGREVLALLKRDRKFKSIPVVVLTTSSSKEDQKYCIDNGAAEFITKPVSVEGFKRVVSAIATVAAGTERI